MSPAHSIGDLLTLVVALARVAQCICDRDGVWAGRRQACVQRGQHMTRVRSPTAGQPCRADPETTAAQRFLLDMADLAVGDPDAPVGVAEIVATAVLVCEAFFELVGEAILGIDALLGPD